MRNIISTYKPTGTLRAVVSPDQTLRYEGRETIARNRLLFHRTYAPTWRLRQNVKWHYFPLFCKKNKGLSKQNSKFKKQYNNFARASHFLYISLPFLHDYGVTMSSLVFYGEPKQATTKFYLSFWAWIWSLYGFNSSLVRLHFTKRVPIIAIKTERA